MSEPERTYRSSTSAANISLCLVANSSVTKISGGIIYGNGVGGYSLNYVASKHPKSEYSRPDITKESAYNYIR